MLERLLLVGVRLLQLGLQVIVLFLFFQCFGERQRMSWQITPNPNAGRPDLPLGIMERKTIQPLIAYYHHWSIQKAHLSVC